MRTKGAESVNSFPQPGQNNRQTIDFNSRHLAWLDSGSGNGRKISVGVCFSLLFVKAHRAYYTGIGEVRLFDLVDV
jgi:hypothetical protein